MVWQALVLGMPRTSPWYTKDLSLVYQGLACQFDKNSKVRETSKELSPEFICYTAMLRISVRTTLVFTPKVDIPDFLTLFLKIGFPKWGISRPSASLKRGLRPRTPNKSASGLRGARARARARPGQARPGPGPGLESCT